MLEFLQANWQASGVGLAAVIVAFFIKKVKAETLYKWGGLAIAPLDKWATATFPILWKPIEDFLIRGLQPFINGMIDGLKSDNAKELKKQAKTVKAKTMDDI